MNKIAFSIGNLSIYWYSIMIAIALIVAIIISNAEVKKQKINKEFFTNLIFYVVIFGILGARLYYVLFNLDFYLQNPSEIIKIWHGGLAIHGGIIAGLLVVIVYTRKYKVNTFKIIDIMVVSLIIAQSIGRWGNFFNQEAYGMITTRKSLVSLGIPKFIIEGMYINGDYYQPTFLYESLWNFIGFIILLILRRRKYNKVGFLTGFYMIWYSIGRVFIEYYRSDSLMLGDVKVAQLVSIVFIIVGIFIIIKSKKGSRFDNLYNQEEKNGVQF